MPKSSEFQVKGERIRPFTGARVVTATPLETDDAANKAYVDSQVGANDTLQEITDNGSITTNAISALSLTTTGLNSMVGGTTISATVSEYTVDVTLTASEIVGTGAGSLGHSGGAELVATGGAGTSLQFVNAVLVYDYDTAAYTGGAGDDLTVYINSVAVSGAIATADLITKAGDTVISLSALTNDYILGVNSNINLASTAVTNPGTAAGVIRAKVTFRVITTGL